jgi:hypothetical protein
LTHTIFARGSASDPKADDLSPVTPTDSVSRVTPLVPGRLFALHNTVALDGRVAAFPQHVTGHAPVNCYLLCEDDHAMMLDTGFTAHRDAILRQVDALIAPGTTLTLLPLRMNEFMSLSNVMALAKHFNVDSCISTLRDAAYHVDLESLSPQDIATAADGLKTMLVTGTEWLSIGLGNKRRVRLFQSPVRLIATRWVFDPQTRTLFTSDMFTGHWDESAHADWVIDDSNDTASVDDVCSFLLNTRYWWLEGAATDSLRRGLADVFAQCDVETIAPGYGKILRGRSVVARHFALLDEALRRLDRSRMAPRYIGRDEVR